MTRLVRYNIIYIQTHDNEYKNCISNHPCGTMPAGALRLRQYEEEHGGNR